MTLPTFMRRHGDATPNASHPENSNRKDFHPPSSSANNGNNGDASIVVYGRKSSHGSQRGRSNNENNDQRGDGAMRGSNQSARRNYQESLGGRRGNSFPQNQQNQPIHQNQQNHPNGNDAHHDEPTNKSKIFRCSLNCLSKFKTSDFHTRAQSQSTTAQTAQSPNRNRISPNSPMSTTSPMSPYALHRDEVLSPRSHAWLYLFAASLAALSSFLVVDDLMERVADNGRSEANGANGGSGGNGASGGRSSIDTLLLAILSTSSILSFICTLSYRHRKFRKRLTQDLFKSSSSLEFVLAILLLGMWCIALKYIMDPFSGLNYGLAMVRTTTDPIFYEGGYVYYNNEIWNGTLWLSSWIGFGLVVYLVGELMFAFPGRKQGVWFRSGSSANKYSMDGLDGTYCYNPQDPADSRPAVWFLAVAFSIALSVTSFELYFGDSCAGDALRGTPFCKRAFLASFTGLFCAIFALTALLFYQLDRMGTLDHWTGRQKKIMLVEGGLAFLSFVLNCINVGYGTSPGGPGTEIGNVFLTSWVGVILSLVLCEQMLNGLMPKYNSAPAQNWEEEDKPKMEVLQAKTFSPISNDDRGNGDSSSEYTSGQDFAMSGIMTEKSDDVQHDCYDDLEMGNKNIIRQDMNYSQQSVVTEKSADGNGNRMGNKSRIRQDVNHSQQSVVTEKSADGNRTINEGDESSSSSSSSSSDSSDQTSSESSDEEDESEDKSSSYSLPAPPFMVMDENAHPPSVSSPSASSYIDSSTQYTSSIQEESLPPSDPDGYKPDIQQNANTEIPQEEEEDDDDESAAQLCFEPIDDVSSLECSIMSFETSGRDPPTASDYEKTDDEGNSQTFTRTTQPLTQNRMKRHQPRSNNFRHPLLSDELPTVLEGGSVDTDSYGDPSSTSRSNNGPQAGGSFRYYPDAQPSYSFKSNIPRGEGLGSKKNSKHRKEKRKKEGHGSGSGSRSTKKSTTSKQKGRNRGGQNSSRSGSKSSGDTSFAEGNNHYPPQGPDVFSTPAAPAAPAAPSHPNPSPPQHFLPPEFAANHEEQGVSFNGTQIASSFLRGESTGTYSSFSLGPRTCSPVQSVNESDDEDSDSENDVVHPDIKRKSINPFSESSISNMQYSA